MTERNENQKKIGYRKDIDGLRAIAVLSVILFHAGVSFIGGGFVGVDVFFVISGFLITSILIQEKESGTYSLTNFYERRIRRIFPALFLIIAVTIALSWLYFLPKDMYEFAQSLIAVPFFSSNILFWKSSGYFDTDSELKPLLHTWSLAVEEQYYILFPIFLSLTWNIKRNRMISLFIAIILMSLILSIWGSYYKPIAAFFLLPSRIWELGLGALTAFYCLKKEPQVISNLYRQIGSLSGLVLIFASVLLYDANTPFPGLYALPPTIGTILVILFSTPDTLVGKTLGAKPLVAIGLISYSAYLWHYPLFAIYRYDSLIEPDQTILLVLSALSLILAYFSWKFVEIPFRKKGAISRKNIFRLAAIASVTIITFGAIAYTKNGFESYYILKRLSPEDKKNYQILKGIDNGNHEMLDNQDCHFWNKTIDENFLKRFETCQKKYGKAVIILGDSHAMNLYNIIARASPDPFIAGLAQGGCRPHEIKDYCQYPQFEVFIQKRKDQIKEVIFHQSGSYLFRDERGGIGTQKKIQKDAPLQIAGENIEKVVQYLDKTGKIVPTIWMGPFVESRVDYNDLRSLRSGFFIPDENLKYFDRLDKTLAKYVADRPTSFKYVSLADILDIKQSFLKVDDCITYRNSDHFSTCGEAVLSEIYKKNYLDRSLSSK